MNSHFYQKEKLRKAWSAIACFDKVREINPNYVDGWTNKGVALSILQRYEEAIA